MKPYLLLACFVMLLTCGASAQVVKTKPSHLRRSAVIFPPPVLPDSPPISIDSVNKYMWNWVTVTDAKVCGYRILKTEAELYLGAAYPNQLLTLQLVDADSRRLAKSLQGKVISIRGRIMPDNDKVIGGRPTMILNDTAFVKVVK